MGDFKQLEVWRRAHSLAIEVYRVSADLPAAERYGPTAQIRRSAYSIPANIAEGCGRGTDRELRRYVRISLGSAAELEYHMMLARALNLISPEVHQRLEVDVLRIQRMLARLYGSLEIRPARTRDQRPETKDRPPAGPDR